MQRGGFALRVCCWGLPQVEGGVDLKITLIDISGCLVSADARCGDCGKR